MSGDASQVRSSLHAAEGRFSVHMVAPSLGVVVLSVMDRKEGDPVALVHMSPEDATAWLESMRRVCVWAASDSVDTLK